MKRRNLLPATGATPAADRAAQAPFVGLVRSNAGFMTNLSLDSAPFGKLQL